MESFLNKKLYFAFPIICLLLNSFNVFAENEDAMWHYLRGEAAFEMATSREGFELAIDEFKEAVVLAPNKPEFRYNLAVVQEKLKYFDDAIENYEKYLFLSPEASDAGEVKNKLVKLEFKKEQYISEDEVASIILSLKKSGWDDSDIKNKNCSEGSTDLFYGWIGNFVRLTDGHVGYKSYDRQYEKYGYEQINIQGVNFSWKHTWHHCPYSLRRDLCPIYGDLKCKVNNRSSVTCQATQRYPRGNSVDKCTWKVTKIY